MPFQPADPATAPRCTHEGCRAFIGVKDGLCAQHDPVRKAAKDEKDATTRAKHLEKERQARAELPVDSIDTIEDALKLSRWLPLAIARGDIRRAEAQAVVASLREYRMTLSDAEMEKRVAELEARLKDAQRRGLDV